MQALYSILPPTMHEAIRQLRAAGFSPLAILMLALQYGPILVQVVQEIIDAWRNAPAPPAEAKHGECDPEVAKHLCAAHCAALKALYETHEAAHKLGCCLE